jgi:hypothetical protein
VAAEAGQRDAVAKRTPLTVTLAAGTDAIRATATTANGGPNVDYLEVQS